jgi:hypothetical protein
MRGWSAMSDLAFDADFAPDGAEGFDDYEVVEPAPFDDYDDYDDSTDVDDYLAQLESADASQHDPPTDSLVEQGNSIMRDVFAGAGMDEAQQDVAAQLASQIFAEASERFGPTQEVAAASIQAAAEAVQEETMAAAAYDGLASAAEMLNTFSRDLGDFDPAAVFGDAVERMEKGDYARYDEPTAAAMSLYDAAYAATRAASGRRDATDESEIANRLSRVDGVMRAFYGKGTPQPAAPAAKGEPATEMEALERFLARRAA